MLPQARYPYDGVSERLVESPAPQTAVRRAVSILRPNVLGVSGMLFQGLTTPSPSASAPFAGLSSRVRSRLVVQLSASGRVFQRIGYVPLCQRLKALVYQPRKPTAYIMSDSGLSSPDQVSI